jgi:hypoxanthine-guanine phosphoribosyltransferase
VDRFARVLDPGSTEVGHSTASDRGFVVTQDVAEQSVLVLDDTLTSGAALQSAASAIRLAGAGDVAAVTVGRYFKPESTDLHGKFLAAATAVPFSFDRCCLKGGDARWMWPPP